MADVDLIPIGAISIDLPDGLSYLEWRAIGETIAAQHRNTAWLVGDWFAFGQTHYADQLKLDLNVITQDPKQLRKAARVASAFHPDKRNSSLSYTHYEHVAGMPEAEAHKLIEQAHAGRLTAKQVRIKAIERKVELGQEQIFTDTDYEYQEHMALCRAWNRARRTVRENFYDMAGDAELGVIDA